MTIELLYFEGCPNYERLLAHLRELLERNGLHEEVLRRKVESSENAVAERPRLAHAAHRRDRCRAGAQARTDFGLKCRLYHAEAGLLGVPPDVLLTRALARRAQGGSCRARDASRCR